MLELSRFRGPAQILVGLIFALVLSSYLIRALNPRWPEWLRPFDATIEVGRYEEIGRRLAGIRREMNTDSWKGPRKIGVLLGSSSTVYDIESTILDVEAGTPFRWLNIAAGSGNVEDCYRIALLLYSSGLEIDTVVCGVHPDMLARTENFLADHSEADSAEIVKEQPGWSPRTVVREMGLLSNAIKDWAFPRALRVNYMVRETAVTFRTGLMKKQGLNIESIFKPAANPWFAKREAPVFKWDPHRISYTIERLFGERSRGAFRGSAYSPSGSKPRDFDRMVDLIESHGSQLIVWIPPQGSLMRSRFPNEARDCLATILSRHPELDGRVCNLNAAISDEHIFDGLHADDEARIEVSRRLASFIRTVRKSAASAHDGTGQARGVARD